MCEHKRTIDDHHTGDIVCTDCGLVFHERIQMGNSSRSMMCLSRPVSASPSVSTVASEWESALLGDHRVVRNEMMETCHRLHIESTSIVESAVELMRYLAIKNGRWMNPSTRRRVFAFALWETLNRANCPRTPQAIAHACGISPSSMLRVETELGAGRLINKMWRRDPLHSHFPSHLSDTTYCPPHEFVDMLSGMLDLPFAVAFLTMKLLKKFEDEYFGVNPDLLLAGAFSHVLHAFRVYTAKGVCAASIHDVNDAKLCEFFVLTEGALDRMRRRFPHIHVSHNGLQHVLHYADMTVEKPSRTGPSVVTTYV